MGLIAWIYNLSPSLVGRQRWPAIFRQQPSHTTSLILLYHTARVCESVMRHCLRSWVVLCLAYSQCISFHIRKSMISLVWSYAKMKHWRVSYCSVDALSLTIDRECTSIVHWEQKLLRLWERPCSRSFWPVQSRARDCNDHAVVTNHGG
jgi:hypothetical protein